MNLAFKTIVAATDFSEQSRLALEYARVLAKRFGANLRVLHIVEVPVVFGADAPPADLNVVLERAVADAQEQLSAALPLLPDNPVIGQVLIGTPADVIVQYAADHDADLIVMGTHGRGWLAHLVMGSVAERVLRSAPCPVFTVRQGEAIPCASRDTAASIAS
jgi:universal stress protein A